MEGPKKKTCPGKPSLVKLAFPPHPPQGWSGTGSSLLPPYPMGMGWGWAILPCPMDGWMGSQHDHPGCWIGTMSQIRPMDGTGTTHPACWLKRLSTLLYTPRSMFNSRKKHTSKINNCWRAKKKKARCH